MTNAMDFSPIDLKAFYKDGFHCPHFTGRKPRHGEVRWLAQGLTASQRQNKECDTKIPSALHHRAGCLSFQLPAVLPPDQEQLFISNQLQGQLRLNYSPPAVSQPTGQSLVRSPSLIYNWCRKSTVNSLTMVLQLQNQLSWMTAEAPSSMK